METRLYAFILAGAIAGTATLADRGPDSKEAGRQALSLVQTIPLPGVTGRFDHFAVDAQGRRLFVAALGNNTLEILDVAGAKRLLTLTGLPKPTGVLYLADSNRIVVAAGAAASLEVFDGASYHPVHDLRSLDDADNLRFEPETRTIFLGYGDGAIAVIDAETMKMAATIELPAHPESFQLEAAGPRLFVNVPDAGQVAVIDRRKRAVIATWPLKKFRANFPMALDETHERLFIGCRRPARLVVLDTGTGGSVADLGISGDVDDLFYDAARKRIYLACGEGFLDVVAQTDADHYERIGRIPTEPGSRTCFYSSELERLWLAVPQRGARTAEIRIYRPE